MKVGVVERLLFIGKSDGESPIYRQLEVGGGRGWARWVEKMKKRHRAGDAIESIAFCSRRVPAALGTFCSRAFFLFIDGVLPCVPVSKCRPRRVIFSKSMELTHPPPVWGLLGKGAR